MHSSRNVLTAMTGGVVVMSLLAFVALTGMSASFTWTAKAVGTGADLASARPLRPPRIRAFPRPAYLARHPRLPESHPPASRRVRSGARWWL